MATATSIEAKIVLALEQAFQTVSLPSGCGVAAPGVVFTPDGTHPYVRMTIAKNKPINVSVSGTREPIRQGILLLTVCWPVGAGLLPASELAAVLRDRFKFNTRVDFVGGYIKVTDEPTVQGDSVDGVYVQVPVVIPWQAFA
jgi:DNA-binding beta-propeller fold protein YncE